MRVWNHIVSKDSLVNINHVVQPELIVSFIKAENPSVFKQGIMTYFHMMCWNLPQISLRPALCVPFMKMSYYVKDFFIINIQEKRLILEKQCVPH